MAAQPDGPAKSAKTRNDADDALRELRVAIEHHDRGLTNIDDLRGALRRFCASARLEHLPPERLLVAVKEALDGLPVRSIDPPSVRDSIRQRVVSLAIRAYYGEAAPDGHDRAQ